MIYTDAVAAAPAISAALERVERILLLTHVNPDGDAIGSMLGMWHALRALGKPVTPMASSALPNYTRELPGVDEVQVYERGMALPDVDLIMMVDTANPERVGRIYAEHSDMFSTQPLVIVDHHVTNEGQGNINYIQPAAASCAELIYLLLRAMQIPVTAEVATCLLIGVTTDTQSFQTSGTNPQSLRIAAELLEAGADHKAVVHNVYYATPYPTAQLLGLALSQLQREESLIWTRVSQAMMRQTGAEEEASDEVVQVMQRIAGVRACALFKERHDGTVKISLRSTPGINVATIAQTWGGGGHTQAAGATLPMNLEAAQREVLPHLRAVLNQHPA